jgi:uncharacterized repeat protein (TIGR01451 family)
MHTRLTLEALEERTLLSGNSTIGALIAPINQPPHPLPPIGISSTGDLIAAINRANGSGTPTTIQLARGVTFNFAAPDNFTDGGNALPVITGNITIAGANDTIARTGAAPYRLFEVASSGSLTLEQLTLQGGLAQGTGTAAEGGAIYSAGTLNLSGVTLFVNNARGNNGVDGGSAYGAGSDGADAFGGGLYVAGGSARLTNDILTGNNAFGGNGGNGINNTPSGNVVVYGAGGAGGNAGEGLGAGLFVARGNVTLSNDNLNSNSAFGGNGGNGGEGEFGGNGGDGAEGGGGSLFAALTGSVILSNDTFSNNFAIGGFGGNGGRGGFGGGGPAGKGGSGGLGAGGGLHLGLVGTVTLSNDTLSNNEAVGGNGGNGGHGDAGSGSTGGAGGSGGQSTGGGMDVMFAGSVTLSDDTLSDNLVFAGTGGIGGYGGTSNNAGDGGAGGAGGFGGGGGLFADGGTFTLTNDTVSGNRVQGGNGNFGGDGGTATISFLDTSFHVGNGGNGGVGGAGVGGGLYVLAGAVSLRDNTVAGNFVGGGVGGGGGAPGSFTGGSILIGPIQFSALPGNGGNGGDALGGGVWVSGNNASLGLANTLIAENTLVAGQGGLAGPHGASGSTSNGSTGTASGPDVSGSVVSSDHDLIGNTSGSSGFISGNGTTGKSLFILGPGSGIGVWTGGSGDILNPSFIGLGSLANNGGPTQTMALLPGSPAIDAGDSHAPGLPATDQRGFARIVGKAVDIGAYESGATPATAVLSISGKAISSGKAGGTITYTLTVRNTSATAQSNVTVADQLPANATLVSWTAARGWSSSAPLAGSSAGTVTAWISSLAANSSATFTLVVRIPAATTKGTVIRNTASFGPFAEASAPGTNSVSFNTTVLS